jgi:hypothetical protein
MVNRVHKIGRHIGAIKSGYHALMGKNLSKAVNAKATNMVGSFKKGGKVKRTGLAKVHSGEVVLSKKQASALKKMLH